MKPSVEKITKPAKTLVAQLIKEIIIASLNTKEKRGYTLRVKNFKNDCSFVTENTILLIEGLHLHTRELCYLPFP